MIVIYILVILIIGWILKYKNIDNLYFKKILKYLFISLIISLGLELTIFNFRFYESQFFKNNRELTHYNLNGIECNEVCKIVDNENAYIEIVNVSDNVHNLYLDIESDDPLFLKYKIAFTDEANKNYIKEINEDSKRIYVTGKERVYVNDILKSHYIKLNPSGEIYNLKIDILSSNNNFTINKIAINEKVPLFIDNIRLLIVAFLSFIIMVFNPKNDLYKINYDFKKGKIITTIIIMALSILVCFSTLLSPKSYSDNKTSQYSQYKNLATSLSEGKFSLDFKVNDKLLNLDNPYDTNFRDSILKRYKDYYWDYAFYNGKYYSYFGIVPCLITYLPYHLLIDGNLPNYVAMSVGLIFFIASTFYFIYELIKKYFKEVPYLWYLAISFLVLFASGLCYFSGEPTFYNMPIIYGISFSFLGLSFWLKSTMATKLNKKYLFLGSLSMALVAGCRPQLLLGSFLAIPIFKDYVFKSRELLSKKGLKETICLCLPFIVVAIFLMYYNYIRFGSVFDFGATYNLTSNDMTRRNFKIDRLFLGIYYFLFAPSRIIPTFPFIEKNFLETSYIGITITEEMYGGFFFANLICLLGLLFYKFRKSIDKDLLMVCAISVISSFIIIIADTEMAGILSRYFGDFGWLFAISTVIVILSLLKNKKLKMEWQKLILGFILGCVIFNFFVFFLGKDTSTNFSILGYIYYKIYYLFMFWL